MRKGACEIFFRTLSGYSQAAITAGDTAALEKMTTYSNKCNGIRSFCPSPRTASRDSLSLLTTTSGSVMYKACSSCFIVSAPPRRFSYFVIRAYSLHFRAIRKFANLCFSGAFSTSKTWGSRKRMSKRSVVSVWYAQNSLPFCTEVWYTTLTGCEDPTKMLMRVCTLLLMQSAPPHGDSNSLSRAPSFHLRDAARTPHGDSNLLAALCVVDARQDAARTPHGDNNRLMSLTLPASFLMQPAPLTGTATYNF